MYQVRFSAEAHADVRGLPKHIRNSLRKELLKLAADPVGLSLELREPLQGFRSYHWRNYRVVFVLSDELKSIAVAAVGQRLAGTNADVYRKLEQLARKGKLAGQILSVLRRLID